MSWKERLLLWFVGALGFVISIYSRLREPFLPPDKRAKQRALREHLEEIQRDQKRLNERIHKAANPLDVLRLSRDFTAKYGDVSDRHSLEETYQNIQAMERESEVLQNILKETGEDFPTAETRYRAYVQENPATHLGRTYLAGTLRQMGKWDQALEVLRDVRQLESAEPGPYPKDLMTRLSIGQVLYDKGEFDAAIEEFESLLAEKSEFARHLHSVTYLSLGTVYLAKGQRKQAHDAWKKAIKYDKGGVATERARELLKNNPL